jgi:hypothetical protein
MFTIAQGLIDQTVKVASLERELAACRAAMTEDRKEQADAIIRSMNEEAANLRPRFTSGERDALVLGVGLALANEDVERTFAAMLVQTLLDMHVTDEATQLRK